MSDRLRDRTRGWGSHGRARGQGRGLLWCSLMGVCFRQINKPCIDVLLSCVVTGMAQVILLDIIMKVL